MRWHLLIGCAVLCSITGSGTCGQDALQTHTVLLITIDGLRWQEVFHGAEQGLMDRDAGGVREPDQVRDRFWAESPQERRRRLMPFFWDVIASKGQILGDPGHDFHMRCTNGLYFSYPGYHELLCGFSDAQINSNQKRNNPNQTVLEWVHRRPGFAGRVAAFTSWDVFPFILNRRRSAIYVNAGWQPLEVFRDPAERVPWNSMAAEIPRYWAGVRYDAFTQKGALEYWHVRQPRLLYVALGEPDDWAHAGRYDLYLDATQRCDQYLRQWWNATRSQRDHTTLIVTTDHGRGDGREGWKSHGKQFAGSDRIWMAIVGPDTPPLGLRKKGTASQSQVAATVASLLGENFPATDARIAPALPGVLDDQRP